MKCLLAEIWYAAETLKIKIGDPLPIQLAVICANFLRSVELYIQQVEVQRAELIRKYGEHIIGHEVRVKPENMEKFTQEWNTIINQEVELDFTPIKIDVSKYTADLKLSISDVIKMSKFISFTI